MCVASLCLFLSEGVLAARLEEYLYEASEEYIPEGQIFKLTNMLSEPSLENYGK